MAGDQSGQLFQTRISGYDKTQVDERVAALEGALRDARARVEELDAQTMKLAGEVSEAHRQLREVGRPSYSGLGLRLLYDTPRRGTAGSRINFVHPKDAGGVLVELVQPAPH